MCPRFTDWYTEAGSEPGNDCIISVLISSYERQLPLGEEEVSERIPGCSVGLGSLLLRVAVGVMLWGQGRVQRGWSGSGDGVGRGEAGIVGRVWCVRAGGLL